MVVSFEKLELDGYVDRSLTQPTIANKLPA